MLVPCTPRGIYSTFEKMFKVNDVFQGIFFAALEIVSTSSPKIYFSEINNAHFLHDWASQICTALCHEIGLRK